MPRPRMHWFGIAQAAALLSVALSVRVTLRNDEPRLDTTGQIIEAGDGCITYDAFTARYYLWGMRYQPCPEPDDKCYAGDNGIGPCQKWQEVPAGQCCGWRNMTISVYSSADLTSGSWRVESKNALPLMTEPGSVYNSAHGAYFEACGAYNGRTGFWTLWFLDRGYTKANAVARAPGGPYEVVSWAADTTCTDGSCADFYLWADLDGTMLMKHNGHSLEYAATLTEDWLAIAATSPPFGGGALGYTEGGGIFRAGGHTFVMAGHGCCFCPLGSNGYLWRADDDGNATGSYSLLGDIIPRAANGSSATRAQQFSVAPVYTAAGVVPMFVGIRFGSAPDRVKDHDFQYWAPLQLDAGGGGLRNLTWLDSFELDLATPPPPTFPPPPPPAWKCSLAAAGGCFQLPASAPGPVYATEAACAAACALCANLSGTWLGADAGVPIHISETPLSASAANVTIAANWPAGSATGLLSAGGGLAVRGGWCAAGATCVGAVAALGDARCASISWGASGTWCNAAVPACNYSRARA